MKTITLKLNQKSIQEAIREIEKYKNEVLRKQQTFVDKLADIGLDVVRQTMASIPSEEKRKYYTEIVSNKDGDIVGAAVRLSGNKILFLEFSAGVKHGSPPGSYPLPSGKQYGYGTYPGQEHALSPSGWWYVDESGEKHHSYGNRAYMPMYHAEQAIIAAVQSTAREVFSS